MPNNNNNNNSNNNSNNSYFKAQYPMYKKIRVQPHYNSHLHAHNVYACSIFVFLNSDGKPYSKTC